MRDMYCKLPTLICLRVLFRSKVSSTSYPRGTLLLLKGSGNSSVSDKKVRLISREGTCTQCCTVHSTVQCTLHVAKFNMGFGKLGKASYYNFVNDFVNFSTQNK